MVPEPPSFSVSPQIPMLFPWKKENILATNITQPKALIASEVYFHQWNTLLLDTGANARPGLLVCLYKLEHQKLFIINGLFFVTVTKSYAFL